ncbi:hypothetical protein BRD14_08595 [Halobacteriales archaeon SW_5_68_122]|nr:MAG: hypothetical protein BRD14_08595 [Halobacteriales archaeon SW_5_68_122]
MLPSGAEEPELIGTDPTTIYRDELAVGGRRRGRGALVAFHRGADRAMSRPVAGDRRAGFSRRNSTRFHV